MNVCLELVRHIPRQHDQVWVRSVSTLDRLPRSDPGLRVVNELLRGLARRVDLYGYVQVTVDVSQIDIANT